MAGITGFDHIGVTVVDLEAATAFFVGLGLEIEGRTPVEGEFLDTVVGLTGARTEIVMLRPPGGGTAVELSRFVRPPSPPVPPPVGATEPGLRSLAFVVEDLSAVLERLADNGHRLVGGVGEHEGVWRMAYVRGPEGIIVALAERIDGD
ncbi:VOC family protein [Rathayibacter sp. VKM Ac-2630]|uniref:VOC family protein n=1 Tax=Rathayibacter sp. VKM Ac-2630 TaxID=1938617 RepID=UPI000981B293|nr:VOC family protein [Rathayibacter sp. VKM Ac-2630]OOB91260.1 glyoxalase [Rathayibacter sp. VKM Ac-2630]